MNREQLDQRNAAAIRRHWRTLTDNGGTPPQQLLEDLAAIADLHAQGLGSTTPGTPPAAILPPSEMIPVTAEHAAAPATPTPRRTATRRRAK
ncbi:MAG: hypothetical protein ACRDOL_22640 [Streptosporangiaceae bacterium]